MTLTIPRNLWTQLTAAQTLIIILFCIQDFDGIIAATYSNNWAEYLVQLIGENGAVAILSILWVDSTCATASCFMSAQRVTFAISRDGVLPFSAYFRQLSENKIPVHAAYLVCAVSVVITLAVIGSSVAFSAITATAAIATNFSYLIPIAARYTVGRKSFRPANWNLGRYSPILGAIAILYIMLLFSVLLLPQLYPVTKVPRCSRLNLFFVEERNMLLNPESRKPSTTRPSASASSPSSASSVGCCRSVSEGDTGLPDRRGRLKSWTLARHACSRPAALRCSGRHMQLRPVK